MRKERIVNATVTVIVSISNLLLEFLIFENLIANIINVISVIINRKTIYSQDIALYKLNSTISESSNKKSIIINNNSTT